MDAGSAYNQCIHNLGYHRPTEHETQDLMEKIRAGAREFATVICDSTMYGRETQMAYTHIEEAVMAAIAGLARNEAASLADLKERGKI